MTCDTLPLCGSLYIYTVPLQTVYRTRFLLLRRAAPFCRLPFLLLARLNIAGVIHSWPAERLYLCVWRLAFLWLCLPPLPAVTACLRHGDSSVCASCRCWRRPVATVDTFR